MTVRGQNFTLFQGAEKTLTFDATALGGGMTGGSGLNWLMQRAQDDPTDQVYKTGTIANDVTGSVTLDEEDTVALVIEGKQSTFWHRAEYTNSAGKRLVLCDGEVNLERNWSQIVPVLVEIEPDGIVTGEVDVVPEVPTVITA